MSEVVRFTAERPETALAVLGAVIAILFVLVIYLCVSVSSLKSTFQKMMTGSQSGASLEETLIGHIEETRRVAEENKKINQDIARIDNFVLKAVTRVGVVRFSAFQDMGSDLSYAVALLDAENNGVVFSSIFAREDSRSYVKPIEAGRSKYTMTKEEEQAVKDAIASAK